MSASVDRRTFLAASGAVLLGACSSGNPSTTPVTSSSSTTADVVPGSTTGSSVDEPVMAELAPADFEALPTCGLVPSSAAGPFGLDQQFDRVDIAEGIVGHPLLVGVRVVDSACAAVTGVAVELWHADPTGDYSAFADGGTGKDEAEGTTFLRGTQRVRADGIAQFVTVYPGWYPGRTPHLHVRVRRDDAAVYTGQLYFADDHTAMVYGAEPYSTNGLPDTTNAADELAGPTLSSGGLVDLRSLDGAGTRALVNLGIEF